MPTNWSIIKFKDRKFSWEILITLLSSQTKLNTKICRVSSHFRKCCPGISLRMRYHRHCSLSVVDTGKAFITAKVFQDVLKLNSKVNHNPEVKFNRTAHTAFQYTWLLVQDLSLGPLLFLICMNDLPKVINNKSIPVLFANDTSILFSHSNFKGFEENMNTVFESLNTWFERNILSLKF